MNYVNFIKKILREIFPNKQYLMLTQIIWRYFILRGSTKKRFSTIYKYNAWGNEESKSGSGSTKKGNKILMGKIKKICKELKVKTFIDSACGDINWIDYKYFDKYIGIDIVESIIKDNKIKTKNKILFYCKNICLDELPQGDLLLIRECLQHLSYKNIFSFLRNLKNSKIKYLLTTNYEKGTNKNIVDGAKFDINLHKKPFNFPKPIYKIKEHGVHKKTSCYLNLYKVSDIK